MLWIFLIILIIFQHGIPDNVFFFMTIKALEAIIVVDLFIFIYSLVKYPLILKLDDEYIEGDEITISFDSPPLLNTRYHLYIFSNLQKKLLKYNGKKLELASDVDILDVDKVMATYRSPFRFFIYKRSKKIDKRIYVLPKMEKCEDDEFTVFENDDLWQKGQDYSEISGFHKATEGDDLRHIHVAMSAKRAEYIIKEGVDVYRNNYHFQRRELDTRTAFKELGKIMYLYHHIVKIHHETLVIHDEKEYKIQSDSDLYTYIKMAQERIICQK